MSRQDQLLRSAEGPKRLTGQDQPSSTDLRAGGQAVSIIVIVTAAAHTRFPLADGISGPNDECEHSDTNEQSHLRKRIGVALVSLDPAAHVDWLGERISEHRNQNAVSLIVGVQVPAAWRCSLRSGARSSGLS
jgi:hypothetical protein